MLLRMCVLLIPVLALAIAKQAVAADSESSSPKKRIGQEVSVANHLADDQEFNLPIPERNRSDP